MCILLFLLGGFYKCQIQLVDGGAYFFYILADFSVYKFY